jgi:hypothetical protein
MKTFLVFEEANNPSGKTKRFKVKNNTGEVLGWIHWRGTWRKYVFGTHNVAEFDSNCLKEITTFLDELMNERTKIKTNGENLPPS